MTVRSVAVIGASGSGGPTGAGRGFLERRSSVSAGAPAPPRLWICVTWAVGNSLEAAASGWGGPS